MTIVIDRNIANPGTHAVVIGVGCYPHLEGGATPRPNTMDLGQLSSPPCSATEFAQWLQKMYNNQDAPLGTLDLLISPTDGPASFEDDNGKSLRVEPAIMENVRTAIERWAARADIDTKSVAIFYFCGHGVCAGINNGLLVEDFGDDHSDRTLLKKVIDIDGLNLAMDGSRSRKQCFFIDACRNTPQLIAQRAGQGAIGDSILTPTINQGRYGARDAPMFFACLPSQKAYSTNNGVSLFTSALIETLNGAGAVKRAGTWIVRTDTMLNALNETIRRIAPRQSLPPQPAYLDQGSGYDLHWLVASPDVPVAVGCAPATANHSANLSLVGRSIRHERPQRGPENWELKCKPGSYDVCATFESGGYRNAKLPDEIIVPPCVEFSLDVSP
jgi:hypothetical protein